VALSGRRKKRARKWLHTVAHQRLVELLASVPATGKRAWTQQRIAELGGVSQQVVATWVAGTGCPSLAVACRLEFPLGIPPREWVTFTSAACGRPAIPAAKVDKTTATDAA
jgi:hypothetical protein